VRKDAVETASKHINEIVKAKVKNRPGRELDGSSLMNTALSPNAPIIVLNDLSTESGGIYKLDACKSLLGP
jgi:hypothetical protein